MDEEQKRRILAEAWQHVERLASLEAPSVDEIIAAAAADRDDWRMRGRHDDPKPKPLADDDDDGNDRRPGEKWIRGLAEAKLNSAKHYTRELLAHVIAEVQRDVKNQL